MTISNIIMAQFIFIILLIFLVLFPTQFILESNTILGKLIAIFIIVLSTKIHFIYGLFLCLIIIFYYQSDYVYNIIQSENFQPSISLEEDGHLYLDLNDEPMIESMENEEEPMENEENDREPMVSQINDTMTSASSNTDNIKMDYLKIDDAYSTKKIPIQSEAETIFRNQKCNPNLELVYKKQIIRQNELIPTIFPEIDFVDNNTPCNPCDLSCPFSIKTSLEKKDFIGQSTRGKTSLEEAMDWAHSFFVNKNEPFSGVDLNVASYL